MSTWADSYGKQTRLEILVRCEGQRDSAPHHQIAGSSLRGEPASQAGRARTDAQSVNGAFGFDAVHLGERHGEFGWDVHAAPGREDDLKPGIRRRLDRRPNAGGYAQRRADKPVAKPNDQGVSLREVPAVRLGAVGKHGAYSAASGSGAAKIAAASSSCSSVAPLLPVTTTLGRRTRRVRAWQHQETRRQQRCEPSLCTQKPCPGSCPDSQT